MNTSSFSIPRPRYGARKLQQQVASPLGHRIAQWLGAGLALAYLVRNTILPQFIPVESLLGTVSYALAALSAVYLLAQTGLRLLPGCILLVVWFPGSYLSAEPAITLPRLGGMAVLMLAVGPLLQSSPARLLRESVCTTIFTAFLFVAVLSACWFALGLPCLGRGDFTGIMNHSMLLAPISGIAVLISLSRALHRFSWVWACTSGVCLLPLLLSGSRTAFLSLCAGLLVLTFFCRARLPIVASVMIATFLLVSLPENQLPGRYLFTQATDTLRAKGLENTRENLWEARLKEFRGHPFFGVGVGYAEEEGIERHEGGLVTVEPGSSYLGLLAMTGAVGAVGFLFILMTALKNLLGQSDEIRNETLIAGAFLLVHAITEGWLLAVGSVLALLFWALLGRSFPLNSCSAREARHTENPSTA